MFKKKIYTAEKKHLRLAQTPHLA